MLYSHRYKLVSLLDSHCTDAGVGLTGKLCVHAELPAHSVRNIPEETQATGQRESWMVDQPIMSRGRSQASTFTWGSPEVTLLGAWPELSVWTVKLVSVQVALGQIRLSDRTQALGSSYRPESSA